MNLKEWSENCDLQLTKMGCIMIFACFFQFTDHGE